MVEKVLVGKIAHYFSKISVGIIDLEKDLSVGDKISIEGSKTNFQQNVDSIQIEHKNVETAKSGDSIGVKVKDMVRVNDKVYKLLEN